MVMFGGKGISGSMNVKVVGSGAETLVLAHGYGTDQTIWDKVVPGLAEKYCVVLFDWKFSGASVAKASPLNRFDPVKYSSYDAFADDLVDLMDEMGFKDSVFVGHSMSAMVGCIASTKRPDLFKHLMLIGGSPRYLNAEGYEGGFERPDVEQMFAAMELNFNGWVSAFGPIAVGPNHTASIAKLEGLMRTMKPENALAVAKLIFLGDYRTVLEEVATPCTIVQTKNDLVAPPSVPYYMQKNIKAKSTIEFVDVDGHFPMLTAPTQLLHVIERALASQINSV